MITFIYSTCRKHPRFEWFIDCLERQCKDIKIQVVLVDFELQYDSTRLDRYQNKFDFIHVTPKPSAFQGKYRLSNRDYFAASIPRNTGVCYAKYDYLIFVDDLSIFSDCFQKMVDYAEKN